MRYFIGFIFLVVSLSGYAQLQQQSLLSTLTADTSPQQDIITDYGVPKSRDTSQQQILFDSYRVPNSSIVNFSIPSGLYRQLCTSCLYDTKTLQCSCQEAGSSDWVASSIQMNDCQQVTVSTTGQLMCLDAPQSTTSS